MRVCQKLFPKGTYKGQKDDGFYMDDILKQNLDALIKNVVNDWDFVIVISGGGMVRLGKSMLAQMIGCYWNYQLKEIYGIDNPFTIKDNVVFHGSQLIKKGNQIGVKYKHSVLIFDEAGADLEGVKAMKRTTQNVKDYLRECGQYNMLTILVLPEYFDLPKGIAMSRSDFLLDCYTTANKEGIFQRGFFNFFSRPNKKQLYLRGKKELNYKAYHYDFHGRWYPFWTLNEENYRTEKIKALRSREVMSGKEMRREEYLKASLRYMRDNGLTYHEMADEINKRSKIKLSHMYIARLLHDEETDDEDLDR